VSTWLVNVGSPLRAARMAKPPGILADHMGWALPGEVRHLGDGVLWMDQMAVDSLRVRHIEDVGDVQMLTGPGGERWPLEEEKKL
jgi:hypothetical protein